jgi:hypothetical protein
MADEDLKEWSADELVAEVRRRERGRETLEVARDRALPRPGTRSHELQHVPSGTLSKLA